MAGSFKTIFKQRKAEVIEPPAKEKLLMRILEPRVLLDAAAVETALDVAGQAVHQQFADEYAENSQSSANAEQGGPNDDGTADHNGFTEEADAENTAAARRTDREVVFIDAGVEDSATLIASLEPGVTVHILDGQQDGVAQMAEILSQSGGYDAVHIFSHGESGALQLGNTVLDASSISGKHADALQEIGQALSENGDILIYGCDFGKGETGQAAAQKLAAATGADIAASDDLTGSESLSGDWDLEVQIGELERQAFSVPKFSGLLAGIELGAVDAPVTGHLTNGIVGTPGTFATWENAATYDPGGGGAIETYDVRAIVVGLTENTSATFETVASGDGSLDDFRVVVTNANASTGMIAGQNVLEEGSVSIVWEVLLAGTDLPAPANIINIVLSDLDGLAGTPDTQDSVSIRTDELQSTTVESGTTLVGSYEDSFITYSGTAQVNNTSNAQVGATWANSNQFSVVYTTYTQTQSFDLDGDGGKAFTTPVVVPTQNIDLNGPATAGNDFSTLYINNADSVSDEDVPTALVDVDMELFDLDSTNLQAATLVLTNAQIGDELRFDPLLLDVLGIVATLTDTRGTDGMLTLQLDAVSGFATVSNFETAIKSIRFANDNPDGALNTGIVRLIEFEVTDGRVSTGGVTTSVQIAGAGLAPVAGANVYVTDEDSMIIVDAASGLIADDKSPTGSALTVTGGMVPGGATITVGVATPLPSGSVITLNSDGSFTYVPPANYSGNETISYFVTGGGFTSQSWVNFDVQPVIDAVVVDIDQPNPVSDEDGATEVFSIAVSSVDASEEQEVYAEDIPFGVIITDGVNSFTADDDVDFVDITDWDRTNLRVLPIQNSDVDIDITIVTANYEVDGSFSFSGQVMTFEIDAVADTPTLQVEQAVGAIDDDVPMDGVILPQLFDTDFSERLTDLTISNIPAGGTFFVAGVEQTVVGGSVTVQRTDLFDLVFRPPATGNPEIYDMLVTLTSEETNAENGVSVLAATTAPVVLRVNLNDSDDPVIALDDTATTFAGETIQIDVLSNDFVPDGNPSVLEINGQAIDFVTEIALPGGEGTVRLNISGDLLFTASTNFAGEASFEYTLRDGDGSTDVGLVTVSVEPRWTIAADPTAVEGGDARFTVTLEGVVNQGDTITVDIGLNPGTADAADYGDLTDAINDSIVNLSQDGFSFDGTTLTYTAPASDYGPVYSPVDPGYSDISTSGTALGLSDDGLATQALGFDFSFYGQTFDAAYISANGYLTFGSPVSAPANESLDGSALLGRPIIAPFWDDLGMGSGDVFTEVVGTDPDRQIVIQWNNVTNETDGSGTGSFQVVLSENNGEVKFYYNDVQFDGIGDFGSGATIGIQGASGQFEEHSFDAIGSVGDGSSLSYTQGINVSPSLFIDIPIVDDPNFEQSENFELQLSNSTAAAIGSAFATTTIEVSDNQAPVAVDDNLTTNEILTTGINVLTNPAGADSDPEGFSISLTAIEGTLIGTDTEITLASGALVIANSDGSLTYNPNGAFDSLAVGDLGMDSFQYEVSDVFGEPSLATVFVTINGVNQSVHFDLDDGGITPSQNYSVAYQPTDVEIPVVSSNAIATDVDGNIATAFEIGLSGFVDPVDEIIRFGGEEFRFGTSRTTTVTFGSGPATIFDVTYNGSTLLSFSNNAGGDMTIAHIELLIRDITYEHASSDDTPGNRIFTFRADDGFGFNPGVVSDIFVRGNNLDPTAVDDGDVVPFDTAEDSILTIPIATLVANDFDTDGDAFDIVSVSGGMDGVATLDGAGNVTFTPAADFVGSTSFTYTLLDARGGTGTGTVFVNVTPVNDAPVVDLNGIGAGVDHTIAYTENDPSISIFDSFGFITDVDDTNIDGATVTITGAQVDDQISLGTMPAGITAVVTPPSALTGLGGATTVTIQFSGIATIADYDAAVRSVSFVNMSNDPVEGDRIATVTATDGELDSLTASTTITLTAINDAPVVINDGPLLLDEDTSLTLTKPSLMANDVDLEGDTFDIISVQDPMNGTVIINGADDIVFTPDPDYFGPASFTYTVQDVNGDTSTALVNLTVNSVNDLTSIDLNGTVAGFDHSDTFTENGPGVPVVDGTVSFSDVDDTQLNSATITLTNGQIGDLLAVGGLPAGISASIVPTGELTVAGTVVVTLSGSASFADYQTALQSVTYLSNSDAPSIVARDIEVIVNDGDDNSNTAHTVVTVIAVNDTPIAFVDSPASFDEDTTLTLVPADLLGNDIDPDGDLLTIISVQSPTNGTVLVNGLGNVEFTPDANYFGPASFTYTVQDPDGEQSTATVNLTVDSVNDRATIDLDTTSAIQQYFTSYTENEVGTQIVGPDIEFLDIDDVNIESATLILTNGQVGDLISVNAIPLGINGITVDVSPATPLVTSGTIIVTFTGTATLSEYETLVQLATFSSASENPDLTQRAVQVRLHDGDDFSSIRTSFIAITAVNDAPVAIADGPFTFDEDTSFTVTPTALLFNDSDPENDTLTIVSVQGATNGTVMINGSGDIEFTPDADYFGPASFTYTVEDGNGGSNTALVDLTVSAVNDRPTLDLNGVTTGVGHVSNFTEGDVSVSIIDASVAITDVDDTQIESAIIRLTNGQIGDVLSVGTLPTGITASISPATALVVNGAIQINLTGAASLADWQAALAAINYTNTSDDPDTTTRSITVRVNDGDDFSPTRLAQVVVTAVNDAPTANPDGPFSFDEDTSFTISPTALLFNDSDPENDALTIVSVQAATNGVVTFAPSGDIEFTPDVDYFGPASFTYTVQDAAGEQSTTTVNLTVNSINDLVQIDLDNTVAGVDYNTAYTEGAIGTSVAGPDVELMDVDDTLVESVEVTLTNGFVGDILEVGVLPGGIAATVSPAGALVLNGTITVTLTGSASLADYQAAIAAVTYRSDSGNINDVDRTITVTANDGDADSNIATSTIAITAVNDAPVAIADGPFTFDEDTSFTVTPTALLFNDSDPENDTLTIVSVQGATNGTVMINGSGDIEFTPDADYFGPASFTYTVEDGNGGSNTALVDLTVSAVNDRPTLDLNGVTTGVGHVSNFTEGDVSVSIIDASVAITDVDDTQIESAIIRLTNGQIGDVLSVGTLPTGITASISPATALVVNGAIQINLTGAASLADWQAALAAINYTNTSDDPDTTTRSITVRVNDGDDFSPTRLAQVVVTAVNDAPTANPDGPFSFDEDTSFTISPTALLFNDSDPENDALTIVSVQAATNGVVTFAPSGDIEFTPDVDYFGPASFTYTVQDAAGEQSTTTVNLTVNSINDLVQIDLDNTVAGVDYNTAYTEGAIGTSVAGPDVELMDVDDTLVESVEVTLTNGFVGDILEVGVLPGGIAATVSPAGALVLNGTITVTLTGSASLADYQAAIAAVTYRSDSGNINDVDRTITVTANDGDADSNIATSTIAITAVNDAPVAIADGPFTFDEDTSFTVTPTALLFNDSDPENDTLTIVSVQGATNGTVMINGSGDIEFTPDADYFGPASFTYTVEDGNGGSNTALVDLTVSAVNDRPTLDLNGVTTGVGHVSNFTEGDVSVSIIDAAVAITDVDDTQIESAIIRLTNGQIGDVLSVGTLPTGITASISPATALVVNGAIQINLTGAASLADWQAALAAINYTNTSDDPDTTTRSITVRVNDGDDFSPTRLAQVVVTAVNDAPTANPDGPFSFDEDTSFTVPASSLLFNDADPESDVLTVVSVQGAVNGSVSIDGSGLITFTPMAHFNGPASFTYTVEDGNGGSTVGSVDLDVVSVNDIPDVDLDGSTGGRDYSTSYVENGVGIQIVNSDISIQDADHIDLTGATIVLTNGRAGDILEVGVLPGTMSASVVPGTGLNGDGQITIMLSGSASLADYQTALQAITYRSNSESPSTDIRMIEINVDDGSDQSLTATTSIAVTSVNDLPDAQDDGAGTAIEVQEDVPLTFDPVLSNDVDLDGDVLTITQINGVGIAAGGSILLPDGILDLDANGTTLTFSPAPNYFGPVTFNYTITDGLAFDTATVNLDVISINDAPIAIDDGPVVLVEDADVYFDPITPNDSDVEGDALNIVAVDGVSIAIGQTVAVANGQITLGGDGRTMRFQPDANFFGTTPLTYTVGDGQDTSDAVVTFDVTAVDDVLTLVGTPPDVTVDDGSVVNLPMASFVDDPDGDPVLYSATGLPAGLSINSSTGVISGVMDSSASQSGPYSVSLTASDGVASTVTTNFTITAVNTIPVTSGNANVPVFEGDAFTFDAGALFSDADADVLVFSETGLPAWASFDPLTGTITGTTPADASIFGPIAVTVTADDVDGGSVSTTVTLAPENVAPVVVGTVPNVNLGEGDSMTFDVAAHFVDGGNDMDVLTYSVSGLPAGLVFDPLTGLVSGVTADGSGQRTPYIILLTADDGQGGLTTDSFALSVAPNVVLIEETDPTDPIIDTPDDPIDLNGDDTDDSVDDTLSSGDLNGTVSLDQDSGVLLSAIGGISTLNEISRSGSIDAASDGLFGSDGFADSETFEAASVSESPFNGTIPSGFDFNSFIEEKELRDKISFDPRVEKFYLDVLNRHDVAFFEFRHKMDPLRDGTIVRTVITSADGSPIPEWMKLVREGFISAKLPLRDEAVELKITIMLGSGNELSKVVLIKVVDQQASVETVGSDEQTKVAEVTKPQDEEALRGSMNSDFVR